MALLARRRRPWPTRDASSRRPASPATRRRRRRCAPSRMLRTYRRNQALLHRSADAPARAGPPDSAAARAIVDARSPSGREMLDELEAKAVLQAYGIPGRADGRRRSLGRGRGRGGTRRIGYPVALKILSPDISHKSDVGGVALDLRDDGGGAPGGRARCWRASARCSPQRAIDRLHGAADGAPAACAGADRRRERRCGVRPGASCSARAAPRSR